MKPMLIPAKKIEGKVVKKQKKAWNTQCDKYIADVIRHFEDFSLTTERLLIDNAYMTEEHRRARTELKRLLVDIDKSLQKIHKRFTGEPYEIEEIEEPAEKKPKLEETVDGSSLQELLEESYPPSDSVAVDLAPGWFHATFIGLR
jgi:hypothetical protein